MLTIADDLSSFALAAGEPFLLDIQFRDATGHVPDASARAFVLSFYRSDRTTAQVLAGVMLTDNSGHFFRFVREGTFSEELLGQSLTVELAERLRNGRYVVARGTIAVANSAAGVPSLASAAIGTIITRVTVRDAAKLGDPPIFSQARLRYSDDVAPVLPVFTTKPSLKDDGSPQVGEAIALDDGVVTGGAVVARQFLIAGQPIDGATGRSYTPIGADEGKPLSAAVTAKGPGGDRTEITAALIVAGATPAPKPAFTRRPVITTDGTPQVDEVITIDVGAASGDEIGEVRMLRASDDSIIDTLQTTSYKLRVTGATKARAYLKNDPTIYADSDPITVAGVSEIAIPAPFQSNPADFVSGTNPPRWQIAIPGPPEIDFDKTKFELLLEWDNPAATADPFVVTAGKSEIITDLMAFADAEQATVTKLTKQGEGKLFRGRSTFIRKSDRALGPVSNYFVDTMAAAQVPPTSFDPALAGAGSPNDALRLKNNDRTAYLAYGENNVHAWGNIPRGKGAKMTFTFTRGSAGGNFGFSVAPSKASSADRFRAFDSGYTELDGNGVAGLGIASGDVVELELVANESTPANIDLLVRKNGGAARRFILNSSVPLYYAGILSNTNPDVEISISDFSHWGTV